MLCQWEVPSVIHSLALWKSQICLSLPFAILTYIELDDHASESMVDSSNFQGWSRSRISGCTCCLALKVGLGSSTRLTQVFLRIWTIHFKLSLSFVGLQSYYTTRVVYILYIYGKYRICIIAKQLEAVRLEPVCPVGVLAFGQVCGLSISSLF